MLKCKLWTIQNVGRSFIAQDETAYIQFLIQPRIGIFERKIQLILETGERYLNPLHVSTKKYAPICTEKEKERISPQKHFLEHPASQKDRN
jgi:hypothetical protein